MTPPTKPSMKEDADVLIIGAGISGMAFAERAQRAGRTVLVLEASERVGGCLHSERLPAETLAAPEPTPYWYELGAHTCYNSYGGLLDILHEVRLRHRLLPRHKAPFRLLTEDGVTPIAKRLKKLPLLAAPFRLLRANKDKSARSVRDYYGYLVGQDNYDRALGALLSAVPSQDASDFPADMLFKKRPRHKDSPRSFTVDGGLGAIPEAIAHLPGVEVRTGVRAIGLSLRGSDVDVTAQDGHTWRAKVVVLATPPDRAAAIAQAGLPRLAEPLGKIGVAQVDSLALVLPRDATSLPPVAGLVPTPADDFFSVVTRDVVPHPSLRAFTFHFRPGLTPERRRARALEVLGARADQVQAWAQRQSRLPAPRLGHRALVQAIDGAIAGRPVAVVGAYFAGLAIEDCVSRARAEAARVLRRAG